MYRLCVCSTRASVSELRASISLCDIHRTCSFISARCRASRMSECRCPGDDQVRVSRSGRLQGLPRPKQQAPAHQPSQNFGNGSQYLNQLWHLLHGESSENLLLRLAVAVDCSLHPSANVSKIVSAPHKCRNVLRGIKRKGSVHGRQDGPLGSRTVPRRKDTRRCRQLRHPLPASCGEQQTTKQR